MHRTASQVIRKLLELGDATGQFLVTDMERSTCTDDMISLERESRVWSTKSGEHWGVSLRVLEMTYSIGIRGANLAGRIFSNTKHI